jgi:6-phosphogluconolactonase
VVTELDSAVTTLAFDRSRGTLTPRHTVSTLPADWKGESTAADIHVASLGNVLYVSNRGHNSIAVLGIAPATGELSASQWIPTEGDIPRNFGLDPSERWLLVANQRSDNVVVYARDAQSGRLTLTPNRLAIPSPVCIRFAS